MGRKPKGPAISTQLADEAQLAALDAAAAEDEVTRAEMIRRLIDYGLDARKRERDK